MLLIFLRYYRSKFLLYSTEIGGFLLPTLCPIIQIFLIMVLSVITCTAHTVLSLLHWRVITTDWLRFAIASTQRDVQYLKRACAQPHQKEKERHAHHLLCPGGVRCTPEGRLSERLAVDAHSANTPQGQWWHQEGQSADLFLKKSKTKVLLIQKTSKLMFKLHSSEASLAEF